MRCRSIALLALVAVGVLSACSRAPERTEPPGATTPAAEVRLGHLPNITHAPALIGIAKGYFAAELGGTTLTTQVFNAGPDEVNALLGGSLDAAFIGSGPAINAFARSNGKAVRLVAGSTSGGAQLVVRPDIRTPEQLRGTVIATPQLGNTQDVAAKKWLAEQGLPPGPGGVTVQNLDNPRTLDLFRTGQIAGGWLPEPWSSRLVEAGARVLVDERDRWPGGRFPATVLIVRTDFLAAHPQTVDALLRAEQQAIDLLSTDPAEARAVVNAEIARLTGAALEPPVLDRAFAGLSFGLDPLAETFPRLATDSVTAGVATREPDLQGFLDTTRERSAR
ncbi:ABC transporter substrate-binding protein [Pseudonocardia hispaniensis]|uniref:ABC transporter substrate-binding protein n=1 Tax=Pseudonocardia hispaniensis TaxID=904933 RepID=A0ABW1J7N1_9PSEU